MKRTRTASTTAHALALAAITLAAAVAAVWFADGQDPAPVLADQAKFYLDCPTTQVREGDSVDVFLVRVTGHQHSVTFGTLWHTDTGTAGTDDYVHQDIGMIWADDSERLANRAKRTFETRQDHLVEGNETFVVRISPEDNILDLDDPDRDERCEITIVDDDPNINGVEIATTPARDDTYGVGETIEIAAAFNTVVEVDGNPALGLWVGSNWESAAYLRGSGSDTLVFGYTVKEADRDTDGIKMDGGYQDSEGNWHNFLNHAGVTAVGTGAAAYRAYAGIETQPGHRVDGSLTPISVTSEITSTPARGGEYRYGETVDFAITFSAPLEVEGAKHLNLRVGPEEGSNWRGAGFAGGSGTRTLSFSYTVQSADLDQDGITLEGSHVVDGVRRGWGGDGTVTVKGTDVAVPPQFGGLRDQPGHRVDGRPYAKTISITSTPVSQPETYGRDEVIQVSVGFDQRVDAGDGAHAVLRVGPVWLEERAEYASGSGTDTLVFEYTVEEADRDGNGVDAFLPHGLDIRASGTQVGYQPDPGGVTPSMGEQTGHRVDGLLVNFDTTSPTVSSVSLALIPGPGQGQTYRAGDWIAVWVEFSESVLVTGRPQIEVNIGGTARQAEYGHWPDGDLRDPPYLQIEDLAIPIVAFGYAVQEGDVDEDGISIGASSINLNGGTIRDEADNNAVLTHDAVVDDAGHRVDAPDRTAPAIMSLAISSDPGDDETYRIGDPIEVTVTFSEDVTVDGAPQLELELDDGPRTAVFSSTDGSDVAFSYTVALNDADQDGVSIGASKLSLNGGHIYDRASNAADLTHEAVDAGPGHRVEGSDTTPPIIGSVAVTSDPGDDDTYGIGDAIEVTVTYTENVTVAGTPQMDLDLDGSTKPAGYSSTDGAKVVFSYVVALNDSDADGVAVPANGLALNGGTIQDEAGNRASLSHGEVAANPGHKVDGSDTTAPAITSLSITSDPGNDNTYGSGDVIKVTVVFSEDVTITGTPQLELDMYESDPPERQAGYSSSASSGTGVVFEYTVAVGDSASDGLEIQADSLALNEGSIKDASGNNAALAHPAISADPDHLVSGSGGV